LTDRVDRNLIHCLTADWQRFYATAQLHDRHRHWLPPGF
jgi:hypothetical protein